MYIEIKTNDTSELLGTFEAAVKKGQHAMLTLTKDGDFWTLSINTLTSEETHEP